MKVNTKKYAPGSVIYLENSNQPLREFYIVKSGKIKITRKNDVLGTIEHIRTNGFIFGVIQCITGIVDSERVETVTNCEILIIPKNKLEKLYQEHPRIILKMLSEYSQILRDLDDDLVEYDVFANYKNRDHKIFTIAEKYCQLNENKKAAHLLTTFINECKQEEPCDKTGEMIKKAQAKLDSMPDSEVPMIKPKSAIDTMTISPGTIVFTEMELGPSLYVLKSGKVKITKLKRGKEKILAILENGAIFGEMAILNDLPRIATAVVEEVSELMIIEKNSINKLPPSLFVSIFKHLSDRIWLVEQILTCLKLPTPVSRLYYFLTAKIRQGLRNPNAELDTSYVLKFPKEELFNMIDLEDSAKDKISDFLDDKNFDFLYDSIKIRNIKALYDRNAFFFTRALHELKGNVTFSH